MTELSFDESISIIIENIKRVGTHKLKGLSREELMDVICPGCPFYHPEKEKLECGAFRILAALIEKGLIDEYTILKLKEK